MHFFTAFLPSRSGTDVFFAAAGAVPAVRDDARSRLGGDVELFAAMAFSEPGIATEVSSALFSKLDRNAVCAGLFRGSRAEIDAAWSAVTSEFANLPNRYSDEIASAAARAALEEPFLTGSYPILIDRNGAVRRPSWGQCAHQGMVTTRSNCDPMMVFEPEASSATVIAQFAAVDPAWARWACRAFARSIAAGDEPPFSRPHAA